MFSYKLFVEFVRIYLQTYRRGFVERRLFIANLVNEFFEPLINYLHNFSFFFSFNVNTTRQDWKSFQGLNTFDGNYVLLAPLLNFNIGGQKDIPASKHQWNHLLVIDSN